jgi:hypothetical protein
MAGGTEMAGQVDLHDESIIVKETHKKNIDLSILVWTFKGRRGLLCGGSG